MGIPSADLNNINLDYVSFDEDDSETFIHVRLMALPSRFKKLKASKNN